MSEKRGVVEILAKEIGADFDPSMERPAVLFAYLRQLLKHLKHEINIRKVLTPSVEQLASRFIERVDQMCDGSMEAEEAIQEACIIRDLIRSVDDEDGWPVDKYLNILVGICNAVRFAFENPCHSRWPAEVGSDLFKARYRFSVLDHYTSSWAKAWLRDRFNEGLKET